MAGYSFPRIAEELGYEGPSGAYKAVMTLLDATVQEPADKLRQMELERLDAIWQPVFLRALGGDLFAVDRCLKIAERRARLQGLDRPLTMNVNWREEAEAQGLRASDIFEKIVEEMLSSGPQSGGEPATG